MVLSRVRFGVSSTSTETVPLCPPSPLASFHIYLVGNIFTSHQRTLLGSSPLGPDAQIVQARKLAGLAKQVEGIALSQEGTSGLSQLQGLWRRQSGNALAEKYAGENLVPGKGRD